MTIFLNGPMKRAHLRLKRAPIYLRGTESNGKFDALDQVGDSPRDDEKVFAYKMLGKPSWCHVNASIGQGGIFMCAEYELIVPQPTEEIMRKNSAWRNWVEENHK